MKKKREIERERIERERERRRSITNGETDEEREEERGQKRKDEETIFSPLLAETRGTWGVDFGGGRAWTGE